MKETAERVALAVTLKAFEILLGIFFVLASAAYWIFERDRAVDSSPRCYHGRNARSCEKPGI